MSSYEPFKINLETNLDQEGLRLGLARLPNESAELYSNRLKAEVVERSGGGVGAVRRSISRQVGRQSLLVLEVGLLTDGDGINLAPNPVIEVFAGEIVLYSDYPEVVSLRARTRTEGDPLFLTELVDLINGTSEFEAVLLDEEFEWLKAVNLRQGNNLGFRNIILNKLQSSYEINVENVISFRSRDSSNFLYLMDSAEDVEKKGDYFIDKQHGVVFTYEGFSGELEVTYSKFPHKMYWEDIVLIELFDPSADLFLKEEKPNEENDGTTYRLLNSFGNSIQRELLQKTGNQWE